MKKKKLHTQRLSAPLFIVLSILIHAFAFGGGSILSNAIQGAIPFSVMEKIGYLWIFVEALIWVLLFLGQSLLIKMQYRWSASKWFFASFMGVTGIAIFSIATNSIYLWVSPPRELLSAIMMLSILLPAFAQYYVLRRYINRAWIWILTLIVAVTTIAPMASFIRPLTRGWDSLLLMNFTHNGFTGAVLGLIFSVVITILVRMSASRIQQNQAAQTDMAENRNRLEEQYEDEITYTNDAQSQLQQTSSR